MGMDVRAQLASVFHLDKCIGCHTCSVVCKNLWTDRRGSEHMWWNNVETRPGTGLPGALGGSGAPPGRLRGRGRRAQAPHGRAREHPRAPVPGAAAAHARRSVRAVDLPLRGPVLAEALGRSAHRAPGLSGDRQAHRPERGAELGRRPRRLRRPRRRGPEPGRARSRGARGAARARGARLLPPAAHLQPLPEPRLRGGLPVRRDLQARRGRGRAHRPRDLPRVADVRAGVPVQEDVPLLVGGQVREVHRLLPADRERRAAGLLPGVRRPDPLPGRAALRRQGGRCAPRARRSASSSPRTAPRSSILPIRR